MSGTSMASPHAAGALALLASARNPNSAADVSELYDRVQINGNYYWTIYSGDGEDDKEPLLDVSDTAIFASALIPTNPVVTTTSPLEDSIFTVKSTIDFGHCNRYRRRRPERRSGVRNRHHDNPPKQCYSRLATGEGRRPSRFFFSSAKTNLADARAGLDRPITSAITLTFDNQQPGILTGVDGLALPRGTDAVGGANPVASPTTTVGPFLGCYYRRCQHHDRSRYKQ